MQIEVKNLTKQFKTKGKRTNLLFHEKENFTAVDNISFNIDKGNIVGGVVAGRIGRYGLPSGDVVPRHRRQCVQGGALR